VRTDRLAAFLACFAVLGVDLVLISRLNRVLGPCPALASPLRGACIQRAQRPLALARPRKQIVGSSLSELHK
jgi:hypothetical protein